MTTQMPLPLQISARTLLLFVCYLNSICTVICHVKQVIGLPSAHIYTCVYMYMSSILFQSCLFQSSTILPQLLVSRH